MGKSIGKHNTAAEVLRERSLASKGKPARARKRQEFCNKLACCSLNRGYLIPATGRLGDTSPLELIEHIK